MVVIFCNDGYIHSLCWNFVDQDKWVCNQKLTSTKRGWQEIDFVHHQGKPNYYSFIALSSVSVIEFRPKKKLERRRRRSSHWHAKSFRSFPYILAIISAKGGQSRRFDESSIFSLSQKHTKVIAFSLLPRLSKNLVVSYRSTLMSFS